MPHLLCHTSNPAATTCKTSALASVDTASPGCNEHCPQFGPGPPWMNGQPWVVGAAYPAEIARVRESSPPIPPPLIPGVGAQGAAIPTPPCRLADRAAPALRRLDFSQLIPSHPLRQQR